MTKEEEALTKLAKLPQEDRSYVLAWLACHHMTSLDRAIAELKIHRLLMDYVDENLPITDDHPAPRIASPPVATIVPPQVPNGNGKPRKPEVILECGHISTRYKGDMPPVAGGFLYCPRCHQLKTVYELPGSKELRTTALGGFARTRKQLDGYRR